MIIYEYPSDESYWKHKLSKANYWLKKYPNSKTQKKRKTKCEKRLKEISEVLLNERKMKLLKIKKKL